jgi:hypothetical protein
VPSILLPLCQRCNRTLGQRYENDAAPIIGPLIDGQARILSPVDQEIVGRWIVKTLLLNALDPAVPAPSAQCEQIRRLCLHMRHHDSPPHRSFVRLAALDTGLPIDAAGHPDLHRPGYLPTVLVRAAQCMGNLAWEVAVGSPRELAHFVAHAADNDCLIRVWPLLLIPVSWPPPTKLVYRDVLTLTLAWNERRWPPSADRRIPSPIGTPLLGLIVSPPDNHSNPG